MAYQGGYAGGFADPAAPPATSTVVDRKPDALVAFGPHHEMPDVKRRTVRTVAETSWRIRPWPMVRVASNDTVGYRVAAHMRTGTLTRWATAGWVHAVASDEWRTAALVRAGDDAAWLAGDPDEHEIFLFALMGAH